MQRFELGLSYDIQKHIESDRYNTLEQMYKRASQIGNILRKEKEKEKSNVSKKRKEVAGQTLGNSSDFFFRRKQELSEIFREVGLVQILDLGETRSLLSHYWTEMAMKVSIYVGDAGEIIPERIVRESWLNVIFATRRDIGSMNATSRKGARVNSRVGNTGSRIRITPEGKSTCSTKMVMVIMEILLRGFNDLLVGDKAGCMETRSKGQVCNVGVIKWEE